MAPVPDVRVGPAARLADSQSDPLVTAAAVNSLGICCKDTGRYEEARSLYERARHLVETQLGTGHPAMADIWHNLAGLDHACNEHGAGESAVRRAIELRRLGGESSPALAGDLAVLAVLLSAQDRLDEG